MKKRIFINGIIIISLCVLLSDIYAQVEQIAQNGGFENGAAGFPTNQNQLSTKCDFWGSSSTADWYTTKGFTGALQGPCPFTGTGIPDIQIIKDALPKINTRDGSEYYGGFGASESMFNELSRSTFANSKVKLSFRFNPRGEIPIGVDINIHARLRDTDDLLNFKQLFIKTINTNDFPPCNPNWYLIETDWINTGSIEYESLLIGGTGNPSGQHIFTTVYFYIDEVKLFNGRDCCEPFMLYENTEELPSLTLVENYIKAGDDAGIPVVSGPVVVKSWQNITFKAGNYIELLPGFSTETGATFTAQVEECSPLSKPTGDPIDILVFPNVITPNGDNVNDELCFIVNGATAYSLIVKNEWGSTVFVGAGQVNSNIPCVWDGTCNFNCGGPILVDGNYEAIITFFNCDNEVTAAQNVQLFHGNNKTVYPDSTTDVISFPNREIKKNDTSPSQISMSIHPNPSSGKFILQVTGGHGEDKIEIVIYDVLGRHVHRSPINHLTTTIDISSHGKGIYMVKVLQGDHVFVEKVIIH